MNAAPHSRFLFRRAHTKEVPAVLSLISQRIRWMDACGIRQWNTTGYEAAYPPSYYAAQGFRPVGTREDGPYRGILREKELL